MPSIVSGKDYLLLPRAPDTWVVEPLIPAGGACLIYGDAKVGKSFAAIQLALAIEQGSDWLGFPTRTRGRVVYVQLDTPRSLWATRLAAIRESEPAVDSLMCADRETLDTFPYDILNPQHADLLTVALREIEPIAVVIDTVRESHSGDENDSTIMRNVVSKLVAITEPAALIIVAHSRKSVGDQGSDLIADNRGSNYVVGRMDSIIRFTRKTAHFTGRAIEEGTIRIHREDNGLWAVVNDELDHHIESILSDPTLETTRSRAQALAIRTGKSEDAARSILRRHALNPPSSTHTSRDREQ